MKAFKARMLEAQRLLAEAARKELPRIRGIFDAVGKIGAAINRGGK